MIYSYNVSEILENIKLTLSENYPLVDIIGEVSEVKENFKSGHIYFSLKDDKGSLMCACWKSNASKLKHLIIEGEMIRVRGKISSFPSNAKVYLSSIDIIPFGDGNIKKALLDLKEKLDKEGFFDISHKKSISFFPSKIGLITSKDGVVIEDIKTTLANKIPCKLQVYDVPVQGSESSERIIDAIKYFNSLQEKPNFLIIARGGGSLEDLYHFNREDLIRSVFKSDIPIISAIGHDPNISLLDLVADKSYATPTASVAFLPNVLDIKENLFIKHKQLLDYLQYYFQNVNNKLLIQNSYLRSPKYIIIQKKENIKSLQKNFKNAWTNIISKKVLQIDFLRFKLSSPLQTLKNRQYKLDKNNKKLNIIFFKLKTYHNDIKNFSRILESFSFKNILKRGFTILYQDDEVVFSKKDLKEGDYKIEFFDGTKDIKINNIKK